MRGGEGEDNSHCHIYFQLIASSMMFVSQPKLVAKTLIDSLSNHPQASLCCDLVVSMLSKNAYPATERFIRNAILAISLIFIVNMTKVDEIEGNMLRIQNKHIPVSRQHRERVLQRLLG